MSSEMFISTAPQGSLAAVGTATKAFVMAHPIALSVVGGAALGVGAYYMLGKMMGKRKSC